MINIQKYLERIKVSTTPVGDIDSLKYLHRQHMLNVPFENLDIHMDKKIDLKVDKLYNKIVNDSRGGFCYELNGLFFQLLTSIGFEAKMISARVFNDSGEEGQDFDHMAIIVDLDEEEWLCDVGFGDSFISPIKFIVDQPQEDRNRIYKIIQANQEDFILIRSDDNKVFKNQYILKLTKRKISDYTDMCIYHQTSPKSSFTQKRLCTLPTETGRITLTDDKLKITNGSIKTETPVNNEAEFSNFLLKYFHITFDHYKSNE